ncbi:MAG: hypothetical protein ABWZ26_04315 [Candidatus Nanopelagicales bacterium]
MPSPEEMRAGVAAYVREIHRAYVDQARTFPPATRGAMPLLAASPLMVAAVGARNLHILATDEKLGPLQGEEVEESDELPGLRWGLRFYDTVVLPGLSLVDETAEPAFEEIRHQLGVRTVLYHFVAEPGAGLSAHNATHVGTGLANGHSAIARDFETIRSRVRGREALVDEMAGAARAGLNRAHAMLAHLIAPGDATLSAVVQSLATDSAAPDPEAVRRAVLEAVGGRRQWTPPATPPRDHAQTSATTPADFVHDHGEVTRGVGEG